MLAGVFTGASLFVANEVAATILGYLGLINGIVGTFNLLLGYPLDGGRVFRRSARSGSSSVPPHSPP
ncbi:MAG: hypothetical protein U0360_09470 [Dehalococcoidia bacterium]